MHDNRHVIAQIIAAKCPLSIHIGCMSCGMLCMEIYYVTRIRLEGVAMFGLASSGHFLAENMGGSMVVNMDVTTQ